MLGSVRIPLYLLYFLFSKGILSLRVGGRESERERGGERETERNREREK